MGPKFKHRTFNERLNSMLAVDFRRMFSTRLLYIMLGICLAVPILILVMTSAFGGAAITDPQTGVEMSMGMFTNAWQIVSSVSGRADMMAMDMTAMCNMNLVYFAAAVLVSLFVSEDFKSGYAKNLFTVRAKRTEYVASKTIVCFIACTLMLMAFFVGALLGGSIAGMSFELGAVNYGNILMCMLAKIFLMAVFVAIFLLMAVFAKQRTWLSITVGFMGGMLLFMMVPMMTPLNASIVHAGMCLAGGVLFSAGIGCVSSGLLKKRDLT